MPVIFPEVSFFLLQFERIVWPDDNPREGLYVLIVLGVIIAIATAIHFIRRPGGGSFGSGKHKDGSSPRKFNIFTLHRISSNYGLDKEQTRLLEFVFRNDGVIDPERVMKNPVVLDRLFKKAYKSIERNSDTEENAQQRLALLFSLRNVIEANPDKSEAAPSQISPNTPAIIAIGNDSYTVKILTSRGQTVVTEIPRNALGTSLRVARGTRVSLSFFTKANKGFSVDGQITGTMNTDFGTGLQISHTGKIKPLIKRKFRRKEAAMKCEFFLVMVEESGKGRKKTSKFVVDNRKFTGTVLDISIGGCSIKTTAPVQISSRLKINILDEDDEAISVLGQVLRTNRSGVRGTVVHIKFLKVPRRAFNTISAMVFGYNEA